MTYEAASLKCAVEGGNLAAIRNAKSQTIIDRIGRQTKKNKKLFLKINLIALI